MDYLLVSRFLASLTIAAQAVIVVAIIYWLVFYLEKDNALTKFFLRWAVASAFFVSLLATLGSLFYSEIAGFVPCSLCWLQRLCLYPQIIILGLAWQQRSLRLVNYGLGLAVIGALISLYHNYLYFGGPAAYSCSAAGVSCLKQYVLEFGYVTIPIMALSAFCLIILLLLGQKLARRR